MVAAVLHLHEGARQAALKTLDEMRRHLFDRHDVADRDLFVRADVERGARRAPGLPRILSAFPTTRSTSPMSANI